MSTFFPDEEQLMVMDLARKMAVNEVGPVAEDTDHNAYIHTEVLSTIAESGLICCMLPEEFGGDGLDYWNQICVIEEIAKECASTAWAVANTAEAAMAVLKYGTDALKAKVLPAFANAVLACVAGNDSPHFGRQEITLRASKEADGYVLNGIKKNVPVINEVQKFLVSATADDGVKWFLADRNTPGLTICEDAPLLGMKGCRNGNVIFDSCKMDKDTLLKGDASEYISSIQNLNIAAIAAGISEGAVTIAVDYVNQRVQFGKRIAEFENTQVVLARLRARTEASKALLWSAAETDPDDKEFSNIAAIAKLETTDTACITTRKCLQLMGGYGYSREYPIERKMRDAKMTEILAVDTIGLEREIAADFVVKN